MQPTSTPVRWCHYEVRFEPLFAQHRGFAFPCDARGRVELDRLGDRARNNYFLARALVGRDFAMPVVCTETH